MNSSFQPDNSMKSNKNPDVDKFLAQKGHPLLAEIMKIREIILNVHPAISESIKWNSPTYMYKGNMASFFMNAKKHVSLMFHKGAFIKDKSGLLEGDGKEVRGARFKGMEDIEKRRTDLESVVREWMRMQDER